MKHLKASQRYTHAEARREHMQEKRYIKGQINYKKFRKEGLLINATKSSWWMVGKITSTSRRVRISFRFSCADISLGLVSWVSSWPSSSSLIASSLIISFGESCDEDETTDEETTCDCITPLASVRGGDLCSWVVAAISSCGPLEQQCGEWRARALALGNDSPHREQLKKESSAKGQSIIKLKRNECSEKTYPSSDCDDFSS